MRSKNLDTLLIRAPRLNQLNVLSQLASDSHLTQAELARRCGLSVAMVNNYMKELLGAGLVEYRRRSSKSISYPLTAAGQQQLSAFRRDLISEMAELFADAKARIRDHILGQAKGILKRVVLCGTGDLAQLAFHALEPLKLGIIGVCDGASGSPGREWCGREVINPSQIRYLEPDAVVIADLKKTEEIYATLIHLEREGIQVIRLDGRQLQNAAATGTLVSFGEPGGDPKTDNSLNIIF